MFRRVVMFLVVSLLFVWGVSFTNAAEKPKIYLKDNVLAVGNYNNSASSSDLSLIVRVEAGKEVVIDEGAEVAYIVPQKDIEGWTEPGFDASDWLLGISGVGYSDNDDNTVTRGTVLSVYTRYYFDIPNANSVKELNFLVDYDDAYIFWLNGVEVARSDNVMAIAPGGIPAWNEPVLRGITDHESSDQPAGKPNAARWNHARIVKHTVEVDFGGEKQGAVGAKPSGGGAAVKGAPLYTKNNVLAAANFNDGPGSSDMTLVLRLSGDDEIYIDEGSPVKYIHDPDNANVPDTWIQTKYDDSKWADGFSGVGFSDNDDNTVTPAGLISIWTRYYFDAPNANKVKELILLADYDDTYLAWLNGIPIAYGDGAPYGDPPAWNVTQGGSVNRESSDQAAGKPNKARWNHNLIQKTTVNFYFAGSSAIAVSPKSKLADTWGNIKRR